MLANGAHHLSSGIFNVYVYPHIAPRTLHTVPNPLKYVIFESVSLCTYLSIVCRTFTFS